jgi:hypothetical protein
LITKEVPTSIFDRVESTLRVIDRIQDAIAAIFIGIMGFLVRAMFFGLIGGGIYYVYHVGSVLMTREYDGKCVAVAGTFGFVKSIESLELHFDRDYLPVFTGRLSVAFADGKVVRYASNALKVVPCAE